MAWRPVLSLALFGLNVVVIRYEDSIRAYGLATACIVLTMALVWRFVQEPTLFRGIAAAVMATVSAQVLYQNAVLVLALCVGGSAVFLSERRWRKAVAALTIGIVPALSLVPYIRPLERAQSWWIILKTGLNSSSVWGNIAFIAGTSPPCIPLYLVGIDDQRRLIGD